MAYNVLLLVFDFNFSFDIMLIHRDEARDIFEKQSREESYEKENFNLPGSIHCH